MSFWQHALDTLDLAFDVRRDHTALWDALVQVEHVFSLGKPFPRLIPRWKVALPFQYSEVSRTDGGAFVCAINGTKQPLAVRVSIFHNIAVEEGHMYSSRKLRAVLSTSVAETHTPGKLLRQLLNKV